MGQQLQCCSGVRKKQIFYQTQQTNQQYDNSCSLDQSQEFFLQKFDYYICNENDDQEQKNTQKIKKMISKELNFDDTENTPKYMCAISDIVSPIHKNDDVSTNSLFQFDESFVQNKKIMIQLFQEKNQD